MPNNQTVTETATRGSFSANVTVRRPGRTGPFTGTMNTWRSTYTGTTLVMSDRVDAYRIGTGERRGEWAISKNGGFTTYHRTLRKALSCLAGAEVDAREEQS